MPAARSSCSLAVVSGDQILVVGGYVDPRNWMGSLTTDLMATVNLKVPLQSPIVINKTCLFFVTAIASVRPNCLNELLGDQGGG